jgi:hypothetical protein
VADSGWRKPDVGDRILRTAAGQHVARTPWVQKMATAPLDIKIKRARRRVRRMRCLVAFIWALTFIAAMLVVTAVVEHDSAGNIGFTVLLTVIFGSAAVFDHRVMRAAVQRYRQLRTEAGLPARPPKRRLIRAAGSTK